MAISQTGQTTVPRSTEPAFREGNWMFGNKVLPLGQSQAWKNWNAYVHPYEQAQAQQIREANKRNAATEATRVEQRGLLSAQQNDPRREAYYQNLYGTALQAGMNPVLERGANDARSAAFNAADRGVLGGSSDIERRTDVRRSVNAGALGAETNAYNFSQGIRQSDEAKYVNLQRLIESSDPAAQAALSQQLSGLNQGIQGQLYQNQANMLGQQIDQYGQNSQSQLIGNALGYAGNLYDINNTAQAKGRTGLWGAPTYPENANRGYSSQ